MPEGRGWLLGSKCVQCGHTWTARRRSPSRCPACGSRRWRLQDDLERAVAFRTPYTIDRVAPSGPELLVVDLRQGLSPFRARVELEGRLRRRLKQRAAEQGLSMARLIGCELRFVRNSEGGTELLLSRGLPFDLR